MFYLNAYDARKSRGSRVPDILILNFIINRLILDNERWKQADVPVEFQALVDSISNGKQISVRNNCKIAALNFCRNIFSSM